jgi:hypothetical protein
LFDPVEGPEVFDDNTEETMQNVEKGERAKRKPYSKPCLTEVRLTPEEAVLGFCRSATKVGIGQAYCTVPYDCRTTGS